MNKFHSPLHRATFRRFFLKSLTLAIPQFVIAAFFFLINNFLILTSSYTDENGKTISSKDTLRFTIVQDIMNPEYIAPLFAILGFVLGIALFYFIDSKRTMTVYYSMGLTRKQLFSSVYGAGATVLSLSIVIPFLANAVINVIYLGSCSALWTQTLYYILFCLGINLFGFSTAAFCMSATGTIFEGAFNGLAFAALPFLFGKFLITLAKRFLNGSAFNLALKPMLYEAPLKDPVFGNVGSVAPDWNPFKFGELLFSNSEKYGRSFKEYKVISSLWTEPGHIFIIITLIALTVLLCALSVRAFSKRKSEFCGMPAANKTMNLFGVTVYGYFIVCTMAAMIPLNYILAAVIALASFVIIFFAVSCLTEHSFKLGFTHWKQGLISVSALGAMIIILGTGGFGYSSYIPDADEIKSARVTAIHNNVFEEELPGLRKMTSLDGISFGDNGIGRKSIHGTPYNGSYFEESEISKVTYLHSKLIESKGYTKAVNSLNVSSFYSSNGSRDVAICYTLKNGKTVIRYFRSVSDEAIEADILIHNNKFYKKEIIKKVRDNLSDETELVLTAPFYKDSRDLDLTPEQKAELALAIEKDIKAQTAEERFFPDKQICGYLSIKYMQKYGYDINDTIMHSESEEESPFLTITSDMVNTINLLQKWGYAEVFTSRPEITEAYITDERNIKEREMYLPIISCEPEGFSPFRQEEKFSNPFTDYDVNDVNKVLNTKDTKQLREIMNVAQPWYPTTRGGYQINVLTKDKRTFTAFIPEDKAPEWVKAIKIK